MRTQIFQDHLRLCMRLASHLVNVILQLLPHPSLIQVEKIRENAYPKTYFADWQVFVLTNLKAKCPFFDLGNLLVSKLEVKDSRPKRLSIVKRKENKTINQGHTDRWSFSL